MKILWVKSDLLHPTTRGGQIRTLEILRRLSRRHEISYVAFEDGTQPEGRRRSGEYCARCYTVPHQLPPRWSLAFAAELARGLVSPVPISLQRYRSSAMRSLVKALLEREHFDRVVCDFLQPAYALPDLWYAILFQHNVESCLWERQAEHACDPATRFYLRRQAKLMRTEEAHICRAAGHVIAVSAGDAAEMRSRFGVTAVSQIPTGVDVDHCRQTRQSGAGVGSGVCRVEVTSRYPIAHGAPVHIGDPAQVGIKDLARPDWSVYTPVKPDEVPVYWACGVTPQSIAMAAGIPEIITHAAGTMFITDLRLNAASILSG